jgi:hypothetical protein
MHRLTRELRAAFDSIADGHDVVPFMMELRDCREMAFQPLPHEMLVLLQASSDYASIRPGDKPTWLQVSADDDALELILYRAEADGKHYVLAPS